MGKKAIFIGPAYPYRGGIAAFNENLATVFQNNGWECKMFTFLQQYPNFLFPGKNQLTTMDSPPNLSIKRAIYSTNPLNWLKITREIVALEPDLVITQYWIPFMAPAFGTILRGIKKSNEKTYTASVVHNFKPHEGIIGDKQLGRFLANRSDLLVSLSDSVAEDITNTVTNKKVSRLFHPIYDHYGDPMDKATARAELELDKDTVYLLFFGLIRSYKGLDHLIKAMALVETDRKFKLIVAGEFYQNEKKYLKLIDEKGLGDKVIIVNSYIPNEDVPRYFCASDLVVLPYKRATQSGVVPVAIHFEVPIIVTRVGGLNEIIESAGIGMTSDPNPESLARCLETYLNDNPFKNPDFKSVKDKLSWQSFYNTFMNELKQNGFTDKEYN